MKSIIIGRDSNQISIALDDEAIKEMIEKLKKFQKNKSEIRFPIETMGDEIDLVFTPLDLYDKRIQEFITEKERFNETRNIKKVNSK